MRKYFLLSAVAALAASTANATTDYAEVTAKATIEVAGTFECDDIDFGTIVVKQNNREASVFLSDDGETYITGDDIISAQGSSYSICRMNSDENMSVPDTVTLSNGTDTLDADVFSSVDLLLGTLHIPANVKAGTYTGTFTVTQTY